MSKAEGPTAATAVPTSAVEIERAADSAVLEDSLAEKSAPVIDEFEQTPHRPSPPGLNGPAELPTDSGKGQEALPSQTKPLWSDEEVEKLRALYPTHSASAIAAQLGRGRNAVRSKAQNLGLRKDGPPTVTSKQAKPAPKPRSLSAAVTADSVLTALPRFPVEDAVHKGQQTHGFSGVSLFDHHPGQCRWIVSDVWPVMYCGAPVVDSSSWCGEHSKRVFNFPPHGLGACSYRISGKFR